MPDHQVWSQEGVNTVGPTVFTPFWDQTWWDKCTWRAPSSNTINDIHDHPGTKQSGVKVDIRLILMQDLPSTWTGSEQRDITHHQSAWFLEDPSSKCPSEAIRAVYGYPICWGGYVPFHACKSNSSGWAQDLVLSPLKPIYGILVPMRSPTSA